MKIRYLIVPLILLLATPLAYGAEFPQRNIRLVVPFEPGGAGDITSRIIVEAANKFLSGSNIPVRMRPGSGTSTAPAAVELLARRSSHVQLAMATQSWR